MRIIGCDLHTRQQTLAMLDTETGEMVSLTLTHEGNNVREFYCKLPRPVRVGMAGMRGTRISKRTVPATAVQSQSAYHVLTQSQVLFLRRS
jgi:hypothetical protein